MRHRCSLTLVDGLVGSLCENTWSKYDVSVCDALSQRSSCSHRCMERHVFAHRFVQVDKSCFKVLQFCVEDDDEKKEFCAAS